MTAVTYDGERFERPLSLNERPKHVPRYYQANTAHHVAENLRDGILRQDIVAPTGSGKTLISLLICLSTEVRSILAVHDRPLRVLYLAHRDFLLSQAEVLYAKNTSISITTHSVYSPLPEHVKKRGWDIAFLDESHHEAMLSFQEILEDVGHTPLIGMTADNSRHDRMMLKFDRSIHAISERDAAEQGFIEKVGINSVMCYESKDLSSPLASLTQQFHLHMGNTLVFFRTAREMRLASQQMENSGLSVETLDADDSTIHVAKKLDLLSRGKIQFLLNCRKLSEGMDTPALTDVILARSFQSKQEKKQYIGRAIRPDSPCAVWEFINPLRKCITAEQAIHSVKYKRLITHHQDEWQEHLYSGSDPQWGEMSSLRMEYSEKYNRDYPLSAFQMDLRLRQDAMERKRLINERMSGKARDISALLSKLEKLRAPHRHA